MMHMKKFTFPGGIHPLPHIGSGKPMTNKRPLTRLAQPETLVFPLCAFIGAPAKPLVSVGDKVAVGQPLGEPGGFVSVYVNASVSGTVIGIEEHLLANGRRGTCVIVKNDFANRIYDGCTPPPAWQDMEPAALREAVKRAGVVGMGGATFPTHVKLTPPADKPIDTVLLNGAECECFLTCDQKLMEEFPADVVEGLRIIMHAVGAKRGMVGVEDNKPEAIMALQKAAEGIADIEICSMVAKYPQGAEKHLIYSLTGRAVPCGKLPSEVGVVVSNVGSAAAVASYMRTGIPPRERILTVSGNGIQNPQNLIVPFGSSFADCIEACSGLTENAAKVLAGGGMTGIAVSDLSVPVVLGTSGITCLTEAELLDEPTNCIRCARCVVNCPLHLRPTMIAEAAERRDTKALVRLHAADCEECGICAYVCPANRPLISSIHKAKGILHEMKQKSEGA